MDLLLIGEGKLKLTLSRNDMDDYDLDSRALDWSDTGTRRAVWSILDEAKKRCGFDAARERVMVQVFPSADGGCEIFVSNVGKRAGDPDVERFFVARRYPVSGAHPYRFDRLSDLLDCCRAAAVSGYSGSSAAYSCDDGRYILLLCSDPPFACEFGSKMTAGEAELIIGEHTSTICRDNAVETLSSVK